MSTTLEKYLPHSWILAVAITLLALSPTLNNGWVHWDDTDFVLSNPLVQDLSTDAIAEMFAEPFLGNYYPLTMLSLAIDYDISGENPRGYHITNLLLHLLNVVLVFFLSRKLFGRFEIALIIAFLFGVHPMHVESVAMIAQRKDMLYAMFFLLAHLSYIRFVKGGGKYDKSYAFSFVFFALALLSKPMAITLPFILLLTDYWFARKFTLQVLLEKLPFFGAALLFGIIALSSQSSAGAVGDFGSIPGLVPLFTAGYGIAMYLLKAIVPFQLSGYHPYPDSSSWDLPLYYQLCLIVPVLLLAIAFYYRNKSRLLTFGLLYFIVSVLPVIQLIPIGSTTYAERYSYLPYFGLFALLGLLAPLFQTEARKRLALIGLAAYVGVLSTVTFQRSGVWGNALTLWEDVIEKYPEDFMGYYMRGNHWMRADNYDNALADYSLAIERNHRYHSIWFNIGVAEALRGNPEKAVLAYTEALKRSENYPPALLNRGILYFGAGVNELAMNDFTAALSTDPNNVEALTHRAVLYKRFGDYDKALQDNFKAIELDPSSAGLHYNRGYVYFLMGDYKKAESDFGRAMELDPRHAGATYWRSVSRYNLGQIDLARADANLARVLGYQIDPEFQRLLSGEVDAQ